MSMNEVSNSKQEDLLDLLCDEVSIDNLFENKDVLEILSKEELKKLHSSYDARALDSSIENMKKSGIQILTIFSEEYPQSMIDIPDRPLILYAKGDLSLLKEKCIGVVGTRMPSNYGKIITEKFAKELAQSGFVIVSGLCYGVDAIAHRSALNVGGKTIAIIGSGFNNVYPASNSSLAEEIAQKNLIMSEYPPSFQAKKYTFPRRNRIVAGICDGVLIPEAGLKSGTLHTKNYALEYGKDLFTIPGNVTNAKSELPNFMIKNAEAECVLSAEDIIKHYGMQTKSKQQRMISLNFDEKTIVDLLATEECTFDYLAEKSKIPVNILNSYLTTLEIRGLIRKLPAQTYALI